MVSKNINIDGLDIKLIKKRVLKNLYIRVKEPNGAVVVSAPIGYKEEEIKIFILKKLVDIRKIIAKLQFQYAQNKKEYISGERHCLWGKSYTLLVEEGFNKYEITKEDNKIIFRLPVGVGLEQKEKYFNEFYRDELKKVLEILVEKVEKYIGISADEYRIKNMKTRWGTCNITKRRIWINLQLAKKPIECLEYVLVHEIVHLLEKNHTNRFHELVGRYYPSWKEAKRKLESISENYINEE